MSPQQPRRRNDQRKPHSGSKSAGDLWKTPEPLPDVEPIQPPSDVQALPRSLGDAPTFGGNSKAGHYVAAVIERTAVIAVALATSADLLADSPSSD